MLGLPYLEILVNNRFALGGWVLWDYWRLIYRAQVGPEWEQIRDAYARKHVDRKGRALHWALTHEGRVLHEGTITPAR